MFFWFRGSWGFCRGFGSDQCQLLAVLGEVTFAGRTAEFQNALLQQLVLGGNQSDQVMIKRIAKNRLLGARRCPWRINQPAAVRPVVLAANGALSTNEE